MAAELRGRFINEFNTYELISRLSDLLPLKEQTCKIVSVHGSVKRFSGGVVECNLQQDDVTAFIENYGKKQMKQFEEKKHLTCLVKAISTASIYTSDANTVLIRRRQRMQRKL